jgi:uncharacterized protein (TIGR03083 family)
MGSIGEAFARERTALRATLAQVGPDAPTACGAWTTTDLAVHLVTGEVAWALPDAPFRLLVGRGIRLDRLAPLNERALRRYRRRHGFDWALARLGREPRRAQTVRGVAAVSLLEVWAHHEDVLDANDLGRCTSGVELAPALAVLVRYQSRILQSHAVRVASAEGVLFEPTAVVRVEVRGDHADLARWLAGRGDLGALTASGTDDDLKGIEAASLRL